MGPSHSLYTCRIWGPPGRRIDQITTQNMNVMKGVGEEVVSQGVISLPMGMERHNRPMGTCILTSNGGPSHSVHL